MQREMTLRKVGASLFVTVPVEVVRAYRLSAGDSILWDIGEDEAKVKFFRVTTSKTEVQREQEAVVDST
jgi:antitoxin component of MazEF toxin-antitoxin module